jgi:transcription elongation factor Elf1
MFVRLNCACGTSGQVEVDAMYDELDAVCPSCSATYEVKVSVGMVTIDGIQIWTVTE